MNPTGTQFVSITPAPPNLWRAFETDDGGEISLVLVFALVSYLGQDPVRYRTAVFPLTATELGMPAADVVSKLTDPDANWHVQVTTDPDAVHFVRYST